MHWKGKELKTVGDLMDAMGKFDDREEAEDFMRLYRADNEHADQNIGYLTGYFGREEMARLQDWCGVAHPIFGNAAPTPEEALEAGKAMGERIVAGERGQVH
jgi:hypothetical protein